jgi:hypothetical protein
VDNDWTYVHEDGRYRVSLLSPDGQTAFRLLLGAENDVRSLQDRIVMAQAAMVTLNTKIQEELTDDALITEEEQTGE